MMYKLTFLCALVAAAFGEDDIVIADPVFPGDDALTVSDQEEDGEIEDDSNAQYRRKGPAMKYKPLKEVGPCEQTMECARNTFPRPSKAPCLGYYSCFKAQLVTKNDIKCIGSASCQKATFYGNSKKVICSGYRSCENVRGSETPGYDLMAKVKVSCDGAFACNTIPGGIYSKDVKCDGDAACSNTKSVAMKAYITAKLEAEAAGEIFDDDPVAMLKIRATRNIECNGKSVCRSNRLESDKFVYCDGDGACRESQIFSSKVKCHGKRACQAVRPMKVQRLEAYGFMGAADAKIIPLNTNKPLVIEAYGFNTLKMAEIAVKSTLKLYAYGWRSAYGAKVYCSGSDCIIECWTNACKAMVIYYKDADEDVTITPEGCHPSLNTAGKAKVAGVLCPTFEMASNRLTYEAFVQSSVPYPEALQAEMESAQKESDEFNAAEDKAEDEYLNALITDLEMDLESQIDIADIEVDKVQDTLFNEGMAIQSLRPSTISSSLIISNVITAVVAVLAFFAIVYYYPQCNASKKGETSPLLP